ncbi:hypothetical protein RclHR1_11300005 [Rhizophagus clarus]|uniref:Uncharacterized protein n=1 Tax=Rhizophagus clarus TaxID=94130 RepID=A0A2Z6QWW8_9GLOM|nr:hypothetical protein RclHR1_11300005 [Rhizophagus clarus]GES82275.1 hypothetical protein GLOIN_2v1786146 [Rhizophagus clarus]
MNLSVIEISILNEVQNIIKRHNLFSIKITENEIFFSPNFSSDFTITKINQDKHKEIKYNKLTNEIYDNEKLIENIIEYDNEDANESETKIIEVVDNKQQNKNSMINHYISTIHSSIDIKNQKKFEIFADCILTIKKKGFRGNVIHHKDVSIYNIIEKCINWDVQNESSNSELLQNYYIIGSCLNEIFNIVKNMMAEITDDVYEKNIVTGIIKGTKIYTSFKAKLSRNEKNAKNRANRFYNITNRVYKVYKAFPYPILQIICTEGVSGDKLMKIGNNNVYDKFINYIKSEVNRNFNVYNDLNNYSDGLYEEFNIDFNLITKEILEKVKKFSINPNLEVE